MSVKSGAGRTFLDWQAMPPFVGSSSVASSGSISWRRHVVIDASTAACAATAERERLGSAARCAACRRRRRISSVPRTPLRAWRCARRGVRSRSGGRRRASREEILVRAGLRENASEDQPGEEVTHRSRLEFPRSRYLTLSPASCCGAQYASAPSSARGDYRRCAGTGSRSATTLAVRDLGRQPRHVDAVDASPAACSCAVHRCVAPDEVVLVPARARPRPDVRRSRVEPAQLGDRIADTEAERRHPA